jgi:hypothetical protein
MPPVLRSRRARRGCCRKTLVKAREAVRAAESEPRFRPPVEQMDRAGKVDSAYAELGRIQVEEEQVISRTGCVGAKVIAGDFHR